MDAILIPKAVIKLYVNHVFIGLVLDSEALIDAPQNASRTIFDEEMNAARGDGDLEALRAGVEYVLAHPEIDASQFAGPSEWDWDDAQVRRVMQELRQRMWPNATALPTQELASTRLTDESIQDWRRRQVQNRPA